jgi:hypothetical protein
MRAEDIQSLATIHDTIPLANINKACRPRIEYVG